MKEEKRKYEFKEEKRKKKIVNALLIFVLSVLVVGSGYCLVREYVYDDNSVVDTTAKKELKTLNVDSDAVGNVMDSFKKMYFDEDLFYARDLYDINSVTNKEVVGSAINVAAKDYGVSACADETVKRNSVSIEKLNDILSKQFVNKKISMDNIESIKGSVSYTDADYEIANIGIIIDGNEIKLLTSCGSVFSAKDYIAKKIIKAEEDDNNLYVYEKQAFARYNNEVEDSAEITVNYYNDYQRKNVIQNNIATDGDESGKNLDWNLYNTYKYTFKKINNNYYFTKFELNK